MAYLTKEALEALLAKSARESAPLHIEEPSQEERDAFKKIERLVKVRDRSEREVRRRLERDGFGPSAIEYAVSRAQSCGFLDDARFADVLVRSRLNAGKGLEGVLRELKGHSIDPFAVLEDFPDAYLRRMPSQADAAYALLCRKPPKAKNARQAAYAKLMRSGYSANVSAEATRRWWREQQEG